MAIDIVLEQTYVGRWTFPNAPDVAMERISGGVLVRFPSVLRVSYSSRIEEPQALVSNLSARVYVGNHELGLATHERFYVGTNPGADTNVAMEWRVPAAVLERYEQLRDGGPVRFCFECRGEVCGLVHAPGRAPSLRTAPTMFTGKPIEVTYPHEAWTAALNRIGFGLHVLVEIPLRPQPAAPWDAIWKALTEAQASFDQGGTTGWVNCVRSIRHALELWQDQEAPDHGPGWHPPTRTEREQRTSGQRMGNLRWDLLQCAHRAPHGHADEWTRDEAVLMMSVLAALLRVRNP
jgi:hypothetical protein